MSGSHQSQVFKASGRQDVPRTAVMRRDLRARQSRLEVFWAWASLLVLIVCWDAALRLDQHASPPRMRIAHVADHVRVEQRMEVVEP